MPRPAVPADGVVVRVMATGMCRSDWHAWAGTTRTSFSRTCRVTNSPGWWSRSGDEVRRWRVGDRVTVPFVCGCGRCEWCRAGNAQVCPDQQQPGFTHWGSFAEYVALHAADTNLVAIPDAGRLRRRGESRMPVRHGVPRPGRPCTGHRGGVGDRGRCRRRRAQRGHDRPCAGCPGGRGGPESRGARRRLRRSARSTRCLPTAATSRGLSPTSPRRQSRRRRCGRRRASLRRGDPQPSASGSPCPGRTAAAGRRSPPATDGRE